MSTNTENIGIKYILEGKYPDFIKNHNLFKTLKKIDKVFPSIGLPNVEEEIEIVGSDALDIGRKLLDSVVRQRLNCIPKNPIMMREDVNYTKVITDLYNQIYNYYGNMCREDNGRVTIKLYAAIYDQAGRLVFKKDESLFKIYNKITEICKEFNFILEPLESSELFKKFSQANLPCKNYKLVFSSVDEKGAWDIATISMRGISSCQSWSQPNSAGLIGSISSRYVGVIYLTDTNNKPFNEYGSKMIHRSMVRFCINKNTHKPALLMDYMYPGSTPAKIQLFKEFLAKRSNLPVLYSGDGGWADYYLPHDSIYKDQNNIVGTPQYTYMDTQIKRHHQLKTAPINSENYTRRLTTLTEEIRAKIHLNIDADFTRYINDGRTNQTLFKGGVANLLMYMKRKIGGYHCSYFLPTITHCRSLLPANEVPLPQNFDSIKEYERVCVRSILRHFAKIKKAQYTTISAPNQCWAHSFPKSSEKLLNYTFLLFKKELMEKYKYLCN